MYTSSFAISTRMSEEAPKAFGMAADVKPAMWAIPYHAKVTAPEGNNDLHQPLPTQWSPQYSRLENDKDRAHAGQGANPRLSSSRATVYDRRYNCIMKSRGGVSRAWTRGRRWAC